MAWGSVNRIRVETPEVAGRVLAAFSHRTGAVDHQPGFLGFDVWRGVDGHEVVAVTRSQRREDFVAWVEGPAFRSAHQQVGEGRGTAAGTLYEVALER